MGSSNLWSNFLLRSTISSKARCRNYSRVEDDCRTVRRKNWHVIEGDESSVSSRSTDGNGVSRAVSKVVVIGRLPSARNYWDRTELRIRLSNQFALLNLDYIPKPPCCP